MCVWTWRTWADPVVDFGREVYIAWRLAAGDVLYRDVVHFCGPLAPYWNALWFRLLGPSLTTIAVVNIALDTAMVAMLYALFRRTGGMLAATAAGLVFVTLFAFAHFTGVANYNWVWPYSHDLTHGVWLGVAGLFTLSRYQQHRRLGAIAMLGLVSGLLLLTKVEALLAGNLAILTGLALTLVAERPSGSRLARVLGVFALAAALPIVVTAGAFALAMPIGEVLRWPLGHWGQASRPDLRNMPIYTQGTGLDDVPGNLWRMATAVFWYAVVFVPASVAAVVLRRSTAYRAPLVAALGVGTGIVLWTSLPDTVWVQTARPLPVFMMLAAAAWLAVFWRRRHVEADASRAALGVALALFGAGMLAKMLLNARIFNYGFALAMPATLVLAVAMVAWLPSLVDAAGGYGAAFCAVALGALAAAVPAHLKITALLVASKSHVIGADADAMFVDARGALVTAFLNELRARATPDQTLIVAPDGILLNYLTRRVNPTPYYQTSPFAVVLWGEDEMLAAFERRPADYVAILNRNFTQEGAAYFGRDYAHRLWDFIQQRYHPVWQRGAPLDQGTQLGIVLMQRNDLSESRASGSP
jgi:hypothetical protein